jgi:cell division protease FtsH
VVFQHLSTGAADDLAKATDIARSMVMRYGMVETLGHVVYEAPPSTFLGTPAERFGPHEYSEETAREIDCAVREIMKAAFERATAILQQGRQVLEDGAKNLLQKETLVEDQLLQLQQRLATLKQA